MGVRDNEIKRILLYAKGLGIKVNLHNKKGTYPAGWSHDPISEINVYSVASTSKTQLILTLLHEIAHHRYYILSGKTPLSDALLKEAERHSRTSPVIPKELRKEIADFEINSLALMTNIAVDLDLQIPMWKILHEQEFDIWVYEMYYEHGNMPTRAEIKAKVRQLDEKYKRSK